MADKKISVYNESKNGKLKITANPGIDYSKIVIPNTTIYSDKAPLPLDTSTDTLRLLAEKRAEADNLLRRKQYTQQQIEKAEDRIKQGVNNSFDLEQINMGLTAYRSDLEFIDNQLETVNKEIELYSSSLSRKTHYEKQRIITNIRYLVNTKKKKLGQIEREASGCQPGYTARLYRSSTEPSLEYVVTAASYLGVTTDLLINADLDQLTATEKYLIDFFSKLERDTTEDKLTWEQEKPKYLNNMGLDENSDSPHPLFSVFAEDCEDGGYPTLVLKFPSNSYYDSTIINNDCYNLKMKNGTIFYLMNIRHKDDPEKNALEVWMYQPNAGRTFICSSMEHSAVKGSLENLYNCLDLWANHPRVDKNLRSVIDAFMADDLGSDILNSGKGGPAHG